MAERGVYQKWTAAVDAILDTGGLRPHELRFVKEVRAQLADRRSISGTQLRWLRVLYRKYGREGRLGEVQYAVVTGRD
jgi:hypothetical protein